MTRTTQAAPTPALFSPASVEGFAESFLNTAVIGPQEVSLKYFRWIAEVARAIESIADNDGTIPDAFALGDLLRIETLAGLLAHLGDEAANFSEDAISSAEGVERQWLSAELRRGGYSRGGPSGAHGEGGGS